MTYHKGITLRKRPRRTRLSDRIDEWFEGHPILNETIGYIILTMILCGLIFLVGVMWFTWCLF